MPLFAMKTYIFYGKFAKLQNRTFWSRVTGAREGGTRRKSIFNRHLSTDLIGFSGQKYQKLAGGG